jgi:hypothetical protein
VVIKASDIAPTVTWGTSPQDTAPITGSVPDPAKEENPLRAASMTRSLEYMGLKPNEKLDQVKIDKVRRFTEWLCTHSPPISGVTRTLLQPTESRTAQPHARTPRGFF